MSLFVRARFPSLAALCRALRLRLVRWPALLLCAGSCLNPQPDPFPQTSPSAPAADTNPNDSNDFVDQTQTPPSPAAQTPPQSNLNGGAETTPPAGPATPSAAPGGDLDAGIAEPDAEAPDATPPANGGL